MALRTFIDRRGLRDGIRNADLDYNFKFLQDALGGIPDKPAGEPIFMVVTGQSNSGTGIGVTTDPIPLNPNVFDWSAGGAGQGAAHGWISHDLNASEFLDFDNNLPYTGVLRGQRGHIGWAAADRIQRLTGRDVYMVCVYKSGTAIVEWLQGNSLEVLLQQRVDDAVASTELTDLGITKADVLLWCHGESDGTRQVNDYVADWNSVRSWMEAAGWCEDRYTQWYLTKSPALAGSLFKNANNFVQAIDNANDEFVRAIRSDRMVAYDNLHFTGDDAFEIGAMVGRQVLAGPQAKQGAEHTWVRDAVSGANKTQENVGIGVMPLLGPNAPLHVQGVSTMVHVEGTVFSQALIGYSDNSSTGDWFDVRAGSRGDEFVIDTQSIERVRVQANGNVELQVGLTVPGANVVALNQLGLQAPIVNTNRIFINNSGAGPNGMYIDQSDVLTANMLEFNAVEKNNQGYTLWTGPDDYLSFNAGAFAYRIAGNSILYSTTTLTTISTDLLVEGDVTSDELSIQALNILQSGAGPNPIRITQSDVLTANMMDFNTAKNNQGYTMWTGANDYLSFNAGALAYRIAGENVLSVNSTKATFTGNVGIGTTEPIGNLSVHGSASSNGVIDIRSGGAAANNARINFGDLNTQRMGRINYAPATDAMTFETAATERMRITSDGKVGIGTADPQWNLEVIGRAKIGYNGAITPALNIRNYANADHFQMDVASNDNARLRLLDGNATMQIGHVSKAGTGNLNFHTNAAERVRITSAGNVGIGTTVPQSSLDVNGTIRIGGSLTNSLSTLGLSAVTVNTSQLQVLQTGSGTNSIVIKQADILTVDQLQFNTVDQTQSYIFKCGGGDFVTIDTNGVAASSATNAQITAASHLITKGYADANYGTVLANNLSWAHCNLSGGILGSAGVSSVTRPSTGVYYVNFTNAAASTNAQAGVANVVSAFGFIAMCTPLSTTRIQVTITTHAGAYSNQAFMIQRTY